MTYTAFMAARAKLLLLCLAALCLPAFGNVPRGLRLTEKLPSHRGSTAFTEGAASETNHSDSFGNRWVTGVRGLVADPLTPAGPGWFSAASNQMTGVPYDAAGNQMQFNPYTLRYDAEGRVVSATSAANGSAVYAYDGEGRRVKKIVNGNTTTVYVYDGLGRLAAEYGAGSGGSGLEFLTEDHLGSVRLVTGALGSVIRRHDYRPFGQDLSGVNGRGPKYGNFENVKRFTGKERDAETGLDYFGARYLSAAQGRFTSPDKPFADQTALDPQSWNLYSYTRNNPLKYVDRNGEAIETAWDALNVGIGAVSFVSNVRQGNYLSAAVDAVGVVIDAAATVAPFVPGGAGTLIKAGRLAGKADDVIDAAQDLNRLDGAADAAGTAKRGPSFLVSEGGDVIPVPSGASGPSPVVNPQGKTTGFAFTGGKGGHGLDPKVTDVRVMDATPGKGSSPGYPNGYVTYQNKAGQGVNPQTGRTVSNSDPSRHQPLSPARQQPPPKACPGGETTCH